MGVSVADTLSSSSSYLVERYGDERLARRMLRFLFVEKELSGANSIVALMVASGVGAWTGALVESFCGATGVLDGGSCMAPSARAQESALVEATFDLTSIVDRGG